MNRKGFKRFGAGLLGLTMAFILPAVTAFAVAERPEDAVLYADFEGTAP